MATKRKPTSRPKSTSRNTAKSKNGTKKVSKAKVVLVTAGVGVAGVLVYLALSGKGKTLISNMFSSGKDFADDIQAGPSVAVKKKASVPAPVVSAKVQNVLTNFNPSEVAELIRKATYDIKGKEQAMFQIAMNGLYKITSVAQYEQANKEYLKIGFVSRTIVSHLLEVFGKYPAYRTQLYTQFIRIGLKQNKNDIGDIIWSLAGLDGSLQPQGVMVQTVAPVRGRFVATGRVTPTIKEGVVFESKGKTQNHIVLVQAPGTLTAIALPASVLKEV